MHDAALIDPRNRVQPVHAENIEIGHCVWVKGVFRLRQLNHEPAQSVVIFQLGRRQRADCLRALEIAQWRTEFLNRTRDGSARYDRRRRRRQ